MRALTRDPDTYDGPGEPVRCDVQDPSKLTEALGGCSAAYYPVHSLDSPGLGRDVDGLSAHLRSRREVEGLLGTGGVPVTVLPAGIVIGHGGISWEMTRQLVEHLPAMVTPRWVSTLTQPIAVDDAVRTALAERRESRRKVA